jgi:hypothetical protein
MNATRERVAIVGCRDAPWWVLIDVIDTVRALPPGSTVVSGDATGVDFYALHTASMCRLSKIEHVADWRQQGKRAGPLRNAKIVESCDRMIAFWDGQSRGTADSIRQCRQAGKPVEIRRFAR